MAKTSEIAANFVSWFKLDPSHVSLTIRRLREDDLFVRETKSPRSPRATARHCANLLVAIMADVPAVRAPKAVERLAATRIMPASAAVLKSEWLPDELEFLRAEDTSFVDAIEWFIQAAMIIGVGFEDRFGGTRFWMEKGSFICGVEPVFQGKPLLDFDIPGIDNRGLCYWDRDNTYYSNLIRTNTVYSIGVFEIGRLLANDFASGGDNA